MTFLDTLRRHMKLFERLAELEPVVTEIVEDVEHSLRTGAKVVFFGNGGSAADSQHLAAEFVVRYRQERGPMAALALTCDTSILTAQSNDYGFNTIYARQVEALCSQADTVIGISTSGNSANVVLGLEAALKIGASSWAWTGQSGGKLAKTGTKMLCVPDDETARIQEAHLFIGHWICEELDLRFIKK